MRFANPPRFAFRPEPERVETRWTKEGTVLTARLRHGPDPDDIEKLRDDELFEMEIKSEK